MLSSYCIGLEFDSSIVMAERQSYRHTNHTKNPLVVNVTKGLGAAVGP